MEQFEVGDEVKYLHLGRSGTNVFGVVVDPPPGLGNDTYWVHYHNADHGPYWSSRKRPNHTIVQKANAVNELTVGSINFGPLHDLVREGHNPDEILAAIGASLSEARRDHDNYNRGFNEGVASVAVPAARKQHNVSYDGHDRVIEVVDLIAAPGLGSYFIQVLEHSKDGVPTEGNKIRSYRSSKIKYYDANV